MAEEHEPVGEDVPQGEAIVAAPVEKPTETLKTVSPDANTNFPPITGFGESAPSEEGEEQPEPQQDAAEPTTSEPPAQEAPVATPVAATGEAPDALSVYRKAFELQAAENARLQQLLQQAFGNQTGQIPGRPAMPGSQFAPAQGSQPQMPASPQTPLTAEMLAEKLVTAPDDPVVQSIVAMSRTAAGVQEVQSILPDMVNDYRQRQAYTQAVTSFNQWLQVACPEGDKPKNDSEAQTMFDDFQRIIGDNGGNYMSFAVLNDARRARKSTPQTVTAAKQEGYQQGLKKNAALTAANVTSAKPSNRRTAPPPPQSLADAADQALIEAGRAPIGKRVGNPWAT